jgi:hypothetical protein
MLLTRKKIILPHVDVVNEKIPTFFFGYFLITNSFVTVVSTEFIRNSSIMPRYCILDLLPVELLHDLFIYFTTHEILLTFSDVSDYINAVILSYKGYCLDFKSIEKSHFDLVCRYIQPTQVILLTLSDDDDTPGQSELFFSRFPIEEFTNLRVLTLNKIEFESLESILTNLFKLKQLRSFSFDIQATRYKYSVDNNDYLNRSDKLSSLLLSTPDQLLPQLNRLYLNNINMFSPTTLQCIRHLKLVKCSLFEAEAIFAYIPTLKSLDICLDMNNLNWWFMLQCNQLIRLNIIFDSEYG